MMQMLRPTYTIEIEVKDGAFPSPQNFHGTLIQSGNTAGHTPFKWAKEGSTGCDALVSAVRGALQKANIENATVTLKRFEHKA